MMSRECWVAGAWLLGLWTAVALLLLPGTRRMMRRWPEASYALLRAGFYALPLGLLAYGLRLALLPEVTLWQAKPSGVWIRLGALIVPTSVEGGSAQELAVLGRLVGIVWLLGVVTRLTMLGGRWVRLRHYLHQCCVVPSELQAEAAEMAARLGLRRPIRLLVGGHVPFSMGGRRPTVVIPELALSDPQARRPILWHELVHLQRRDFQAKLAEEVVLTFFWFHPLLWSYRQRLELLREVLCDRAVLAHRIVSPAGYARLLLAVLLQAQRAPALKLGLFLSRQSTLKQRMEAMMYPVRLLTPRQVRLLLIGTLIGLTGLMACSEMPDLPGQPEATQSPPSARHRQSEESFIVVEEMPRLIGGLSTLAECIRYPEEAKKAGIEGRVIVRFIVDEDGNVARPEVVRGVGAGLDEEALRCVRQLRFEPGRQQGRPVPVRMTLPVVFQLNSQRSEQAQK